MWLWRPSPRFSWTSIRACQQDSNLIFGCCSSSFLSMNTLHTALKHQFFLCCQHNSPDGSVVTMELRDLGTGGPTRSVSDKSALFPFCCFLFHNSIFVLNPELIDCSELTSQLIVNSNQFNQSHTFQWQHGHPRLFPRSPPHGVLEWHNCAFRELHVLWWLCN